MLANAAAMNYGFAFRAATYAGLMSLANQAFGPTGGRLVVDSPHNSIYEEDVDGESADRAPSQLVSRLPGVEDAAGHGRSVRWVRRRSSPAPAARRRISVWPTTVPRRACTRRVTERGASSATSPSNGKSQLDPMGRTTIRFGYSDEAPNEVPQLDDRGVNEALAILTQNGLSRPVARLRPLAVLR